MNGILLQHGYLIAKIKADEDTRELYYKILKASITKENKEDLIRFIASEKESLKQYPELSTNRRRRNKVLF
jgi:hypothetical protein